MEKNDLAWEALKKLAWSERKEVGVVLIYGLASSILSLGVPVGIQTFVNKVGFGTLNQPVLFLVFAVFACLVCASIFRVMQVVVSERIQRRIFTKVATELSYRLPRVSTKAIGNKRLPEKVNRFLDVVTIQKSAALLLLDGFTLILQAIAGLALLAFYHPFLLAFDVVLVIMVGFILFGLGRGAIDTSLKESATKYQVLAWLEELAEKTLSIRSQETRKFATEKTEALVIDFLKARTNHFRIILRQVVGSLGLQAIASAGLLAIGAYLVVQNQLTLGQLVAAEIVVTLILTSLQKFQKHLESFYDLVAATGKVNDLLSLDLEREDGEPWSWKENPAAIELRAVEFSVGKAYHLPALNLKIAPGEKLAVLGSNGSGKSTLADIIAGTKLPTRGTVVYDGHDIRDIRLEELRAGIAVVRDLDLFEATILENIRMGNPTTSIEQIRKAIQNLGLEPVIDRFEQGLHLKVNQEGRPLSGAQAHRLALVKGLAIKPKVIVIDEWLDTVDERSAGLILDIVLRESATVVLCTHRRSLANQCTKILDLDEIKWEKTG